MRRSLLIENILFYTLIINAIGGFVNSFKSMILVNNTYAFIGLIINIICFYINLYLIDLYNKKKLVNVCLVNNINKSYK